MKRGYFKVKFEITVEGKDVDFVNLPESDREHILACIGNGYREGELFLIEDEMGLEDEVEE